MKVARKLLLIAVILTGVLAALIFLAMLSPVQTWVARKVVAGQAEIGRVSAGLSRISVEGVKANYDGARLELPRLDAEFPILNAVLHEKVAVTKLTARGWTLDLTHYHASTRTAVKGGTAGVAHSFSLLPSAYAAEAQVETTTVFDGVFSQLQLPVDASLDGVVLEGTVIFPAKPGQPQIRAKITLVGGGLAEGHEGAFNLTSRLDVKDASVNAMDLQGTLKAMMDTPRTFSKVAATINAQARGSAFPQGVQLTADVGAARVTGGENYSITVQSVGKRLFDAQVNYPENSTRLGGVWRLDVRDTDLAPFVLGRALPGFEAIGSGMFESDTGLSGIHTAGRIKSSASRLEVLDPSLEAVGAVNVFGEFDLSLNGAVTRLDKLTVDITRPEAVLGIRSLQSFEINTSTSELKVADPSADLVAIDLQGVPLAWTEPFLSGLKLSGGNLKGRLMASARHGSLILRSAEPLTAVNVAVSRGGEFLAKALDLSMELTADYTTLGWQAEITKLTVGSAGERVMDLTLKAGRPPGADQPLKTTGRMSLSIPALLHQPVWADMLALTGGMADVDFSASIGVKQEIQAQLKLTGLVGPAGELLPSVASDVRLSIEAGGRMVFNLPLTVTSGDRKRVSDLLLGGTLESAGEARHLNARLGGGTIYLEDLQLFAALIPGAAEASTSPANPGVRDEKPFWHGVSGDMELALKKLIYNGQFEVSDVSGSVQIEAGEMKFDAIRAGLGGDSDLTADGGVSYQSAQPEPYALAVNLDVKDFDTAPLFKALNPGIPPQVDGRFELISKVTGRGGNVAKLFAQSGGDLQLTSKGGVFRLLSTDMTSKVESAGTVAAVGAFLGNVASALGKGKSAAGFANKSQAVVEFSKMLTAIQYDQLNVSVVRDGDLNTVLKDFTLIAPEVRLAGSGRLAGNPAVPILEQMMTLDLQLKARGRIGEAMGYLNVLTEQKDDLGYATCLFPIQIGGTLAQPDTSALQATLTKLALDQSGATDLLNRLLGK